MAQRRSHVMLRRQLLTGLLMTVVMIVLVGLAYPLVVTGIGQVFMSRQANGSLVKNTQGKVVGSSLIGQNFADKDGNPLPQYFQPRPSKAGNGYDGLASGGSNYGPSNANLVGNQPGAYSADSRVKENPYATPADPYCVPVQATDQQGNDVTDAHGNPVYEKNHDGTYVCNPGTVPERTLAYRAFNDLAPGTKVPSDAVTASGSGLDPAISLANARLQAPRVAKARNLGVEQVQNLIDAHTQGRQWGVLGEQTVNVLDLNLALDKLKP
jgi:K+-transporting ATPase ATPase C chain